MVERPHVSCGDINVEVILECANDIHDIKGIEAKILNEVGIVGEAALICYAINCFLNKFKKLFFQFGLSLLRMILDPAYWLRSGGA